jgi:hypothetical protein
LAEETPKAKTAKPEDFSDIRFVEESCLAFHCRQFPTQWSAFYLSWFFGKFSPKNSMPIF